MLEGFATKEAAEELVADAVAAAEEPPAEAAAAAEEPAAEAAAEGEAASAMGTLVAEGEAEATPQADGEAPEVDAAEGTTEGTANGAAEGAAVGAADGAAEGAAEGELEGELEGEAAADGAAAQGEEEGAAELPAEDVAEDAPPTGDDTQKADADTEPSLLSEDAELALGRAAAVAGKGAGDAQQLLALLPGLLERLPRDRSPSSDDVASTLLVLETLLITLPAAKANG
jgi:hypothetical protein